MLCNLGYLVILHGLIFIPFGFQESDSEEEGLDEVDEDVEEEHDNELEKPVEVEQPIVKNPPEAPSVQKDSERQLSKKELKKKGLEELDALLAEMGLNKESGQDGSHGNFISIISL